MRMLVAPLLGATTALLVGCGGDAATPTPGGPRTNGAPAAPTNVTEFVDDGVAPDRAFAYAMTAENEMGEPASVGLTDGNRTMLEALASLVVGSDNLSENPSWTSFLLFFYCAEVPNEAVVNAHGPP